MAAGPGVEAGNVPPAARRGIVAVAAAPGLCVTRVVEPARYGDWVEVKRINELCLPEHYPEAFYRDLFGRAASQQAVAVCYTYPDAKNPAPAAEVKQNNNPDDMVRTIVGYALRVYNPLQFYDAPMGRTASSATTTAADVRVKPPQARQPIHVPETDEAEPVRPDSVATLHSLAVLPAHRRQGWAKRLLAWQLQALRQLPAPAPVCHHLFLQTRPTNRIALHLYRSMGFAAVATVPAYYHNPGEDAVLLMRYLA